MKNKRDYRLLAKNIRKNLDLVKLSQTLTKTILQDVDFIKANHVMIYYPLDNELDFRGLLAENKNFYIPKMDGNSLVVCPYCDELICGKFNVMEPCSEPVNPDILDFVLVPALMVDKNCNRLGYGAGYYDRFLKKCINAVKVVALPKELLVDLLPFDEHDVKVDKILIN